MPPLQGYMYGNPFFYKHAVPTGLKMVFVEVFYMYAILQRVNLIVGFTVTCRPYRAICMVIRFSINMPSLRD